MTSIDHSTSVTCRDVADTNGRAYRIGESDAGLPERQDSRTTRRFFGIALKVPFRAHRCGRRDTPVTATAIPARFLKAPGRRSVRRIVPNPHPLGEEMA
ncbi:hypothetical protein ACFYZJ_28555 [Streptomyces sp. NPDC001848]|uniref:hypothetical protein n=1 Tax=Streptomyces sp. NPDC001848 TaxID=3364618 RepID=UPI00368E9796